MGAVYIVFFFQAEDGIRDIGVTGVQTCALPISASAVGAGAGRDPARGRRQSVVGVRLRLRGLRARGGRRAGLRERPGAGAGSAARRDHPGAAAAPGRDRKSTRLNSSHANISYAVFCLKKKKKSTSYS